MSLHTILRHWRQTARLTHSSHYFHACVIVASAAMLDGAACTAVQPCVEAQAVWFAAAAAAVVLSAAVEHWAVFVEAQISDAGQAVRVGTAAVWVAAAAVAAAVVVVYWAAFVEARSSDAGQTVWVGTAAV